MNFGTLGTGFGALGRGGAGGGWTPLEIDGVKADLDIDFIENEAWYNGAGASIASLLSISRANPSAAYYENSDGSLSSFGANALRYGNRGLLIEESRVNVVLWNRDLTNAAWTASNVTAAKNQTGADGTANAASSITASATNGTILQAITLASSARFQSVYVKRITGSGALEMTMDNGSTWVTPTLWDGSAWTNTDATYRRIRIPSQTLANPTVGFRIATSGDAFAVDFVQNENGADATSPLATTTASVTRSADAITANSLVASLLTNSAVTTYARAKQFRLAFAEGGLINFRKASTGVGDRLSMNSGPNSTARPRFSVAAASSVSADVNTGSMPAYVPGSLYYLAATCDGTSAFTAADNTIGTSDTSVTMPTGLDTFEIGSRNASIYLNGYIERMAVWASKTSSADLQVLTTPS